MNNLSEITRLRRRFDKKHGGNPVAIDDDHVLYADGAISDGAGGLYEPPDDPEKRAELCLQYAEIQYERAVRAFEDARAMMLGEYSGLYDERFTDPDDEDAVAALKELQQTAKAAQREYAKARKEYRPFERARERRTPRAGRPSDIDDEVRSLIEGMRV